MLKHFQCILKHIYNSRFSWEFFLINCNYYNTSSKNSIANYCTDLLKIISLWLNNHNYIIVIHSYLLHSIRPHCVRWLCWTLHASYICLHFTNYKMRKLFSLTNTSMLKLFWWIYKWMQVSLFSIFVNTKHLECHECNRIWLCTLISWTFFCLQ
jgi:hypothetical protein